jgi:hypothetical protein
MNYEQNLNKKWTNFEFGTKFKYKQNLNLNKIWTKNEQILNLEQNSNIKNLNLNKFGIWKYSEFEQNSIWTNLECEQKFEVWTKFECEQIRIFKILENRLTRTNLQQNRTAMSDD